MIALFFGVSFGHGGSSSNTQRDFCPSGDYTDSYYDGSCGIRSPEAEERLLTMKATQATRSINEDDRMFEEYKPSSQDWSVINHIVSKFKGDKQAKYLLGAIIGVIPSLDDELYTPNTEEIMVAIEFRERLEAFEVNKKKKTRFILLESHSEL